MDEKLEAPTTGVEYSQAYLDAYKAQESVETKLEWAEELR
jgi:hypothetical protein